MADTFLDWLDASIEQARKGTEWHGKEFWTELRTLESVKAKYIELSPTIKALEALEG